MDASLVKEVIEQSRSRQLLVAFSCMEQTPGSFHCGYVTKVDEDAFWVDYVDPIGAQQEGETGEWYEYDEILWLKMETPYLVGLAQLDEVRDKLDGSPRGRIIRGTADKMEALAEAQGLKEVVTLLTGEDGEAVVPSVLGEQWMLGELINEDDGSLAGQVAVDIENVSAVRRGSLVEHCLTMLYRLRYGDFRAKR
jgi:hypothetical protein